MDINLRAIQNLQALSAQTVSNSKSGHTGSAISAAPMLFALFNDHLKFNPKDPNFMGRDRFVLSAGHASAILYSLLHMFGYDVTIDDLKSFRKYKSKTPGHPEYGVVPGVETTTGPLGQGVANSVGLAIAEKMFAANFNTKDINLYDNYTYCYVGDGCLMEGVAVEACSLAGTLHLNKLILLYEDNNITIDGARTIANNEDTAKKFEAMGWNTITIKNGNDYYACTKAISAAKKSNRPTIIIFKTIIGEGTSLQGTNKIHAHPLTEEELKEFLSKLNIQEPFAVIDEVKAYISKTLNKKQAENAKWVEKFQKYTQNYPENAQKLKKYLSVKKFSSEKIDTKIKKLGALTGRDCSGLVLNEVAKIYPELVGGAADLVASTKAAITDSGFFSNLSPNERNIHFGIREHAMGSICNGISLYQGQPVFDSTFLVFSNYMLPAIRLRAMMNLPVLSIFTHDSINIGQDGPTHQPIESITCLRSIPNNNVFRPATTTEVVAGYKLFLEKRIPMSLVLSKSNLLVSENSSLEDAEKGAYVIYETKAKPQIEIFASGTEVELAINVAKKFDKFGARVISMPCESIFNAQDKTYKEKVLLKNPIFKIAIEASNDNLWYKYIGENGLFVGVFTYQFSGSGSEVYKNAGFNEDAIYDKINKKLKTLL